MLLLSFLIWRRHMIHHGNMELCKCRPYRTPSSLYSGLLTQSTILCETWYQKSDLFDQEMAVPQGSIMSVTLFALKINSVNKNHTLGVECSLYVDHFLICYCSRYMQIIERHLQQTLNKLQTWVDKN